jgi:hypothetical protein
MHDWPWEGKVVLNVEAVGPTAPGVATAQC